MHQSNKFLPPEYAFKRRANFALKTFCKEGATAILRKWHDNSDLTHLLVSTFTVCKTGLNIMAPF
jgi:hypothetical protein